MESSVGEEMIIMPLGGGQEVGRSCILLQYQNRNILLDCGCHPGREGDDSLPFFDALSNPGDIDLILITHFHIDHCAALPYFTERTDFKGKIYMTHPTKAVMKLLLSDNIRLQTKQGLYNEQDLQNCIDKIDVINYHQTVEYKGIKFTATAAGHVLGAAMFSIEIDGIRVLYTGDYSMEEDRHLAQAEVPPGGPPDVLIIESTFGTMNVDTREKREDKFTKAVESIVLRGGSCLIPVFALGRAQELLLILDNYWQENLDLQHIPIFYASKLATRSLRVYQTFVNMMNRSVRHLADQFINPFKLQHIKSVGSANLDVFGPCVVMASPGFLQSGVSRELFEAWCDDERHGVIIAGYTIEGTLAHELLSDPKEIRCLDNRIKPRRCRIESISFSAHVDYQHNRHFIRSLQPDSIVLVHGEKKQMKSLKDALDYEIRTNWPTRHKPTIATPENGATVKFRFKKNIQASVEGGVGAELLRVLEHQQPVSSETNKPSNSTISLPENTLLVTENFTSKLVSVSELAQQTQCRIGSISEKLQIPLPLEAANLLAQLELQHAVYMIAEALEDVYEGVEILAEDELVIQQLVMVKLISANSYSPHMRSLIGLEVVWKASAVADFIADSVASLLMQMFSASNLLKMSLANANMDKNVNNNKRPLSRALRHSRPTATSAATQSSADRDDPVQSSSSAKKARVDATHPDTTDQAQLLADMRAGKIDPFHALPSRCPIPPVGGLQSLLTKLQQWQAQQTQAYFSSVQLSQDGSKLIFRGQEHVTYEVEQDAAGQTKIQIHPQEKLVSDSASGSVPEAYVYILFNQQDGLQGGVKEEASSETQPQHEAVVSAEDDNFRRVVCTTLQSLQSL